MKKTTKKTQKKVLQKKLDNTKIDNNINYMKRFCSDFIPFLSPFKLIDNNFEEGEEFGIVIQKS